MKGSSNEKDDRIAHFQESILEKFSCPANHDDEQYVGLFSPVWTGLVSVFSLPQPPNEYPEAKLCFAWDAEEGSGNVVAVLDVQVLKDPPDAQDAVCAWLNDSVQGGIDHYLNGG